MVNENGHVLRALEIADLKINVQIQVSGISLESCQIIYWKARPGQIYTRRMLRLATVKMKGASIEWLDSSLVAIDFSTYSIWNIS